MSAEKHTPEVEYIELQTGIDPKWSVIWLHGLGADGHDFEPVAPQLGFNDQLAVRFIFPHAPIRPITINGGMEMRGWYDIIGMHFDRQEDRAGLEESMRIVEGLIEQEIARGVASENIFLAGFSQGGAIALFTALRLEFKLAGVIALSTYLPDAASSENERHIANANTPIFMAHGTRDPVIPVILAEQSYQSLKKMAYQVEWKTYPMEHSVSADEIQDISRFMHAVIRSS